MAFSEQEMQIMERLAGIPEAREDLKQVVGKHLPGVVPDYDIEKKIAEKFQTKFDEQQKALEELKTKYAKREIEDNWKIQSDKIKKQLGWDDVKLSEFQKAFNEEFKDGKSLEMYDLAEYYHFKNQPLAPASNPKIGPFGLRREHSSEEEKWRQDSRDPKSPMFSKNKRERKAYWRGEWNRVFNEMQSAGIK